MVIIQNVGRNVAFIKKYYSCLNWGHTSCPCGWIVRNFLHIQLKTLVKLMKTHPPRYGFDNTTTVDGFSLIKQRMWICH